MTEFSARKSALGFLGLWGLSTLYLGLTGADWTFPIVSLVLFGGIFSALTWWLTRGLEPFELPIANPARESKGLLLYVLFYALVLIGILLGTLKESIAPGPAQSLAVLGYKLIIHVAVPFAIITWLGGNARALFTGIGTPRKVWWRTLVVLVLLFSGLMALVSPALEQIGGLGLPLAGAIGAVLFSWAWLSLEAGLCEEFLFRAALQTRLTAWLKSPAAAIVAVSIVFALGHWPGLYFRGGPDTSGWSSDPLQVAAYCIAVLAPLSVMIGVMWERTRSLLLVVLVHGAIDAMPNTAELYRVWF